ncbi:MAG: calcium/sodium antiporter [Bacteroidales bacterium]|nr:calcium/sodium antiporter [Bacteroidales bacterium]
MALQFLLLIAGLLLILFGANWLVDGSSSIAKKTGLSEFVIGLTIVGIGTSTPEMVVSFISSFQGKADMAIGNIVGSNIFNTLIILGITAVILPLAISKETIRRDLPLNLLATALLIGLGMKHSIFGAGTDTLTRVDGLILLSLLAWYFWILLRKPKNAAVEAAGPSKEEEDSIKVFSTGKSLILIAAGLGGLVFGGRLFVDSATEIAVHYHMSQKFIAITIMAAGTSLPELATCVVAALKGRSQLALGNVLGSNIFNILLILGGSALIHPLKFGAMTPVDVGTMMISAIFLILSVYTFKKNKLDKFEGAILLLMEAGYMTWLFMN